MTTSRRTNLTDPVAEGVDYQDARVDYAFNNSVATRLEYELGRDVRPRREQYG
jgi:hypothetical protein